MNKKVVITGAGGALGTSLSRLFRKNSWCVIEITKLSHCSIASASECIGDVQSKNDKYHQILKDLNIQSEIDCVVNCIGRNMSLSENPLQTSTSLWSQMRVNLEIPAKTIEFFYPNMKKPGGVICNVASISGMESHGHPGYSAAKAALIAYTRSVGRFLAKEGISMFSVSPGAFLGNTESYWNKVKDEDPSKYTAFMERMSVEAMADSNDVAAFIFGLIGTVQPYIAGSNIPFDGGQGRRF